MVWTRVVLIERQNAALLAKWSVRGSRCFHQPQARGTWRQPGRFFSAASIWRESDRLREEQASQRKSLKCSARKAPTASKTSLRRSANEPERARDGTTREPRKKNRPDFGTNAKVVTAYCVAEQYSLTKAARVLKDAGYQIDPARTELYPQVVHVKAPSKGVDETSNTPDLGDVFVFPSGTVVAWNVDEDVVMRLISKTLLAASENPHINRMETEDFEFTEDTGNHTSSIVGDMINLGTGIREPKESEQPVDLEQHETDLTLVRIAFSSGLAGSVKLAVLESTLENYFKSTRSIPGLLSKGTRLPFTRSFILRKTGELLNARAQLNLNNELTDSLPDMFWDSRHELGLEGYFDRVGKALDVNVRSRVLNQKMDYAQEIVTVLREQLSEKHGLALEWLIIILIAIEVAFEILRLWREKLESEDPESRESLMRRFLQKELGGQIDQ